jgi:class 3 adenylate cyclase
VQYSKTIRGPRPSEQSILTILFTDIERSVANTQRLGDIAAQALVRAHNAIVRQALRDHRGVEVKHTGDGIMATFGSAAHGVGCAVAIMRASREHNAARTDAAFGICIGMSAGEPVVEDADLFGTAVQLASRACDRAEAGQIITTDVVRQLVAGRGFRFDDCGEAALKGFVEPVRLWQVNAVQDSPRELPAPLPRWFRRAGRARVLAAAAPIALIAAAGAITAGVLLGASGDAIGESKSQPLPPARSMAVQFSTDATITRVSGDCAAEDLVVSAKVDGSVTGDIVGTSHGDTTARLHADSGCHEASAIAAGTIVGEQWSDTLAFTTHALSVTRLVGVEIDGRASTSTAMRAALIVVGGRGRWANAQGTGTCRILAQTTEEAPGSAESLDRSEAECTLALTNRLEASPVLLQAVSGEDQLTTLGGPADLPKSARIAVAYANNGDTAVRDAVLVLPEPQGARLAVFGAEGAYDDTAGVLAWRLPDIEPGEVGQFFFQVQLLAADGAAITLEPELRADGLDEPAKSDPITLAVVR